MRDLRGSSSIFLTGATGFLGRHLLYRFLEDDPAAVFLVLVRPTGSHFAPEDRIRAVLAWRYGHERARRLEQRVTCVPGDVTLPRFGVEPALYERLAAATGRIVHAAASVAMDLPVAQMRRVNLDGTRRVLHFAAAAASTGALQRLDYIGTAYVAGDRTGIILEDELERGQGFRNSYEQTKYEAERLVRQRGGEVPTTIYRPSIIVGDSQTGATSSFNVIYTPLMIYARGLWRWIPGSPDTEVDLIPVDHACRAIAALGARPETIGGCYHIVAGERSTTVGELAALARDHFDGKPVRYFPARIFDYLVRPLLATLKRASAGAALPLLEKAVVYLPYFTMNLSFDDRRARQVLDPTGIRPPRVGEYFVRILQYCSAAEWDGNGRSDGTEVPIPAVGGVEGGPHS